jgi:acid stress-induced BolA-like protein IbaG/YrbA
MQRLTQARLKQILTSELKLRDPEFRLETYGNRINGSVISPTFKRKDDMRRQDIIWDALEKTLGPDSVKLVGMILAYTPDEWYFDQDSIGVPRKRLVGK